MLKLELTDNLLIKWGNETKKARLANGLDNIQNNKETIKVILEGDSSYNPVTVKISDIIAINRKGD